MKKICLLLVMLALVLSGCGFEKALDNTYEEAVAPFEGQQSSDAKPAETDGCNVTKKPKGCNVFDTCNMLRHMNYAMTKNSFDSWACLHTTFQYGCDTGTLFGCTELIGESGAAEAIGRRIDEGDELSSVKCYMYGIYYDGGRENLFMLHKASNDWVELEPDEIGVSWVSMFQITPGDINEHAAFRDWEWAWYFSDELFGWQGWTPEGLDELLASITSVGKWTSCE